MRLSNRGGQVKALSMLRPARESDFETAHSIYMDPLVNPYMSWEIMDLPAFSSIFDKILRSQFLYAFEDEQKIAAFIRLERGEHRRRHVAYIGGFAVSPIYQNQGWGQKVMRAAIGHLKAEGVERIELTVESDNPRAIKLYQKLGFEIEGNLKRFFKRAADSEATDDYYMALDCRRAYT